MVDRTDDWMNPRSSSVVYKSEPPINKTVYLIEREKRVICFGSPGSIREWTFWASFDTKEERDKELAKLRKDTIWSLRAREHNPYMDQIMRRCT